jgi:hypothetical protein
MGAVVTNQAIATEDLTLAAVNGKTCIDIPANRVYAASADKASFTVRVANVPLWAQNVTITARPYCIFRDGDEEFPEDANYEGMWFLNCSTPVTNKPGVRVLEDGQLMEALDDDDFYSGCWGCAAINFFAYNTSGNQGVAAGLNNLVKTRDDKRLGGSRSAEQDFADLTLD